MFLLIPASVVAIGAIVRGALILSARNIGAVVPTGEAPVARDEPTTDGPGPRAVRGDSPIGRIIGRLDEMYRRTGTMTAADARVELEAEMIYLFVQLQPLAFLFVIAPLIGLLGSVTGVMSATLDTATGGAIENLAAAMERALIPTMWGVGVSVISYAGFALLRMRLYYCERVLVWPAVESHLRSIRPQAKLRGESRSTDRGVRNGT
jgi:hypothetical protein